MRRRVIATVTAANVSSLAEDSTYDVSIDGGFVFQLDHKRSEGALELLRKILNQGQERGLLAQE